MRQLIIQHLLFQTKQVNQMFKGGYKDLSKCERWEVEYRGTWRLLCWLAGMIVPC